MFLWLTWDGADFVVVMAAAIAVGAALVAPAAGDLVVIWLVASISAGSVWDDWKRREAFSVQLKIKIISKIFTESNIFVLLI